MPVYSNNPARGRTAVRALIAKGLGYTDEATAFPRRGGDARQIIKAAIGGIATSDTSPDVGTIATEFFGAVVAGALIGKLPLRQIQFHVRMLAMTQGTTGYWIGQGSPKPLSRPTLTGSLYPEPPEMRHADCHHSRIVALQQHRGAAAT